MKRSFGVADLDVEPNSSGGPDSVPKPPMSTGNGKSRVTWDEELVNVAAAATPFWGANKLPVGTMPPSLFRRNSSNLSNIAVETKPVVYHTPTGPRKTAPVELVAAAMPTTPTDSVTGKFIKFTNCRIVRGHQLIREDIWIKCVSVPWMIPCSCQLVPC